MAAASILERLKAEFDTSPEDIEAIVGLLERGASAPFITRFRRDETHDAGQERIIAIGERFHFLAEQEARKATILDRARAKGWDVEALLLELENSVDQDLLDDYYHALHHEESAAHRRTEEFGLGALVEAVHAHDLVGSTPIDAAGPYISEERGLPSAETVLEAVALTLAERYGHDPGFRSLVRDELSRGILRATAAAPGQARKGARRFQEFFDFQEPVRRIPAQRMLALRRAEREGIVSVRLHLPEGRELQLYRARFSPEVDVDSQLGQFLDLIYQHSYEHFVHPSCEATVRHKIKEKADRETVRNFARTLRAQLLSPALGARPAMAVRASNKSVWVVSLRADGSVGRQDTLQIPPKEQPPEQQEEWLQSLAELVRTDQPAALAIPHGRREERAAGLVGQVIGRLAEEERPLVVPVDETASVVYATSADGRRKQPNIETGMRATISLCRRLRDPMLELLRVEPRGLGLGQNLTEVHQGMLNRELDAVLSSCVAAVGVDVNQADADLLARVPGIGRELAKAIVEHRDRNGPFATRSQLADVPRWDDTKFLFVAGFLRVRGGTEPLDATEVHPEDYGLVARIAELKGVPVPDLLGQNHKDVRLQDLISPACGRLRALDVLHALAQGDHDPRGTLSACRNEGVSGFDDLRVDQRLDGRVTNITEFGAFVDLGIGQDGLVHVSQIPGSRMHDARHGLCVGEVVSVYVVHLDPKEKRISLSMHKPRHLAEGRKPTLGERLAPSKGRGEGRRRGREEQSVMTRAARAPEGRRGAGRRGPRPPRPKSDAAGQEQRGSYERSYSGRSDSRPGKPGQPRVITVESERSQQETRGHKGELRSLAGLRALLERAASESPSPKADPADSGT